MTGTASITTNRIVDHHDLTGAVIDGPTLIGYVVDEPFLVAALSASRFLIGLFPDRNEATHAIFLNRCPVSP
jgi:hypothetical protein